MKEILTKSCLKNHSDNSLRFSGWPFYGIIILPNSVTLSLLLSPLPRRNLDSTIGDFFDMSKLHKNIEMIDLRDNQLNVDDMHVLRMILKNMPDLKIALLGGNQFYKELDDHMFHMNSNLLYLDVSNAGVHEFHKDTGCFFLKCHILGAFGSK